jgi:hypothetical protein
VHIKSQNKIAMQTHLKPYPRVCTYLALFKEKVLLQPPTYVAFLKIKEFQVILLNLVSPTYICIDIGVLKIR